MQPAVHAPRGAHHDPSKSLHDELVCKIAFIGDTRVGKSAIIAALRRAASSNDANDPDAVAATGESAADPSSSSTSTPFLPTIGVEFSSHVVRGVKPMLDLRLQFWDAGGEALYAPDMSLVLRYAAVVVCVFDSSNEASFRALMDEHLPLIAALRPLLPPECILVVENKIDVRAQVEAERAKVSPGMRRLQQTIEAANNNNADNADADDGGRRVELVDLRGAQAELFALLPEVSYVDMTVNDNEKVQFLLTGIVDLILNSHDSSGAPLVQSRSPAGAAPTKAKPAESSQPNNDAVYSPKENASCEEDEAPETASEEEKERPAIVHPHLRDRDEARRDLDDNRASDDDSDDSGDNSGGRQNAKTANASKGTTKGNDKKRKSASKRPCGCACCGVM